MRVVPASLIPIAVATLIGLATVNSNHSSLDGLAPSARPGPPDQGLVKRYPTGVEALHAVSRSNQTRRVLRAARPEWRRQVDADPLRHRAGAADVGDDPRLRPRRRPRLRRGPPRRRTRPQELNLDWFLTVEETLDYHAGYFGMPSATAASARGAARDVLAHGEAERAHPHALRRHEAPADPGPRADAPPAPPHPRRADRRRRHRAAARAVALRAAHQRRRGRRSS